MLLINSIFGVKMSIFDHLSATLQWMSRPYLMLLNLYTTSGLLILLHCIISLPDATSCDK